MIVPNRNLLNTILVFTMLSFTMTANAASTGSSNVARTKCTSVEQELVDFEILEQRIRKTNAIGGLAKLRLSGDIEKIRNKLNDIHSQVSSTVSSRKEDVQRFKEHIERNPLTTVIAAFAFGYIIARILGLGGRR